MLEQELTMLKREMADDNSADAAADEEKEVDAALQIMFGSGGG